MAIDYLQRQTARPIWIPGLAFLAVIFYLLEFVCWHSHWALMQKPVGLALIFSWDCLAKAFYLSRTPEEYPHLAFSRLSRRPTPTYKESNPRINVEINPSWGYMDSRSFKNQPGFLFVQGSRVESQEEPHLLFQLVHSYQHFPCLFLFFLRRYTG